VAEIEVNEMFGFMSYKKFFIDQSIYHPFHILSRRYPSPIQILKAIAVFSSLAIIHAIEIEIAICMWNVWGGLLSFE